VNSFGGFHMLLLVPLILSANFANFEKNIKKAESVEADFSHFDVMNGRLVSVSKNVRLIQMLNCGKHLIYSVK